MHYTLFELERIEKILRAKLAAASEAYQEADTEARAEFGKTMENVALVKYPDRVDGPTRELAERWEKYREGDDHLKFLHEEVVLFKEGVDSLYSYWNHSVEIFIDNMRTRTNEKDLPSPTVTNPLKGPSIYIEGDEEKEKE